MSALDPKQTAYLRTLLFEELHQAAEALAELAAEAAEGTTEHIAGDNARSALPKRVLITADVLDSIGWSVLGNPTWKGGG